MRGLSTKGSLRFKIDWASLIVERKFTDFALFYFVFEGNFQVHVPVCRGDLTVFFFFFALRDWWAYIWRGLYMEGLIFGNSRYPPIGELACRLRPSPLTVSLHLQTQTNICVDGFRVSTFHVNGCTSISCERQ